MVLEIYTSTDTLTINFNICVTGKKWLYTVRNPKLVGHHDFYAPNFEVVEGAYWFDHVRLSVTLSCGHDILRTD